MTISLAEVTRSLIRTVDKRELLSTLRHWKRHDTTNNYERNLIDDLIAKIEDGDLDG